MAAGKPKTSHRRRRHAWLAALGLILAILTRPLPADEPAPPAEPTSPLQADKLLATGRYEEAAEQFAALATTDPVAAAIGLSRCCASVGRAPEAEDLLRTAITQHPPAAGLQAELACLLFSRGEYDAAQVSADAALAADPDQLPARWIRAELARESGQLDEALAGYEQLVNYYNEHDITSAESLRWIGLGAAQFARWKQLPDQFKFLVNELYPDANQRDPTFWQAHYEAGLLFLEKYNQAEATRSFQAALKLNPAAADVHAALARLALQSFDLDRATAAIDQALDINPKLLAAHQARADVHLANFDADRAIEVLRVALDLHPQSQETLGRLAAAYLVRDGMPDDLAQSEAGRIYAQVLARNPHPGNFLCTLATSLEERRRFPAAERFFHEAIERMPQLPGPQAGLGMLYMRLGREDEARQLLTAAFQQDPFHVRVSNTLQVLEVLTGYQQLESDHFIVRFDPAHDHILARYALAHLERVHPQLVQLLGYQPREKALFEIFNRARNTDGHGWFSARMVGLPYVGTVGACAGTIVALASPNDAPKPFNWARVLQHEFVHVVNLQQTQFNIPHWFTEGIATWNEGFPRPAEWNELLVQRSRDAKLFDLDQINFGFIRPRSGQDWQLAYCQAELYVEYMLQTHGPDAVARMLAAFGQNKNTRQALPQALGVSQQAFEQGYQAYVKQLVEQLSATPSVAPRKLAELERALAATPDDPALATELAVALVDRKEYPAARRLAETVRRRDPRHPLAAYVLARLHLVTGETAEALALLQTGLDPQRPEPRLLNLLAGLEYKAKHYTRAVELYTQGAQLEPANLEWSRRLARVYLASGDDARLAEVLAQLAAFDADDLIARQKLAQLALARKDFAAAARWANEALQINVMDAATHRMLAEAYTAQGHHPQAVEELSTAVEIDPDDPDLLLALARACHAAGDPVRSRATLEALRQHEPDHPAAQQLLELLDDPPSSSRDIAP